MSEGKAPFLKLEAFPIKAAAWRNEGKDGKPWYSVKVQKVYKDDQGNWTETTNFAHWDLPVVAALLTEMWGRLLQDKKPEDQAPKKEEGPRPF